MSVDSDAEIDVKDYRILRPLLEAIIAQENGRVIYSGAQLDEMLRRGGVTKPGVAEVPLPPVKSAGLAAASTGAVLPPSPAILAYGRRCRKAAFPG